MNQDECEKFKKEFGAYMRKLRESKKSTIADVSGIFFQRFPDSIYQHIPLTCENLSRMEKGFFIPNPFKIRELARLYGEKYEFLLYKAGYIDKTSL